MNEDAKKHASLIYHINGKNLKKLRDIKGYKQEELAKTLGISTSIISRIEKGEMGLSAKHIGRLYTEYGIKPSFFYEVDDEKALETARVMLRNKDIDDKETTGDMLKELQTFIGYLNAKYAKDDDPDKENNT